MFGSIYAATPLIVSSWAANLGLRPPHQLSHCAFTVKLRNADNLSGMVRCGASILFNRYHLKARTIIPIDRRLLPKKGLVDHAS